MLLTFLLLSGVFWDVTVDFFKKHKQADGNIFGNSKSEPPWLL